MVSRLKSSSSATARETYSILAIALATLLVPAVTFSAVRARCGVAREALLESLPALPAARAPQLATESVAYSKARGTYRGDVLRPDEAFELRGIARSRGAAPIVAVFATLDGATTYRAHLEPTAAGAIYHVVVPTTQTSPGVHEVVVRAIDATLDGTGGTSHLTFRVE